jgi:hypothetical protein
MDNHDTKTPAPVRRKPGRPPKPIAPFTGTPVLIDTGNARPAGQQARIAVKDPENAASRQHLTQVPKRLEALYILFADTRELGGAVLTREELEVNPRTKSLPKKDKDALVKYWPKFSENLEAAREIRKLREEDTALALAAEKQGVRLRKAKGIDDMPVAEQLTTTAHVFHNQILKASLALAATNHEDIHTDPLSRELYKNRIAYVKDYIWIARNLVDLSDRIKATDNSTIADGVLNEETLELLNQADAMLLGKGVKLDFTV